jgi:hypothetical protein
MGENPKVQISAVRDTPITRMANTQSRRMDAVAESYTKGQIIDAAPYTLPISQNALLCLPETLPISQNSLVCAPEALPTPQLHGTLHTRGVSAIVGMSERVQFRASGNGMTENTQFRAIGNVMAGPVHWNENITAVLDSEGGSTDAETEPAPENQEARLTGDIGQNVQADVFYDVQITEHMTDAEFRRAVLIKRSSDRFAVTLTIQLQDWYRAASTAYEEYQNKSVTTHVVCAPQYARTG